MKKLLFSLSVFALVSLMACREKTPGPAEETEPAATELTAREHAQLGSKKLYVDWDYKAAKKALLKAVELNPEDAVSHANLAWYWMLEDNKEKSLEAIQRAQEAAPDNPLWPQWHGWLCYFYDEFDCAEKNLKRSIEIQPEQRDAYFVLGRMNYRAGNMQEAYKWLEKASQDSSGKIAKAMYYVLKGQDAEGRELMKDISSESTDVYETMIMVPLFEMLGQRDSAFYYLRKNYDLKHPLLPWLRFMPILRPLHDDPRFWELVDKIGRP